MIISRTPLRVSLCSSDYPHHYLEFGGGFVGFTISQYIYLSVRKSPKQRDYHSRLVYSQIESVQSNSEIQHNAIRNTLDYLNINYGVEVVHAADINAKSGLGSSASFIVGLLKALSCLEGKEFTPNQLADSAFFIESFKMGVTTGIQDHIHSSFGGLAHYTLTKDGDYIRNEVKFKCDEEAYLKSYMLLFNSGVNRAASDIAKTYVGRKENIEINKELTCLSYEIFQAIKSLDVEQVGKYIDQGWQLKKKLSDSVSTNFLDEIHNTAISNGALAVRVCGAGGGGVVLVLAPPKTHSSIRKAFSSLAEIDFNLVHNGSRIILNDEDRRC